MDAVREIDERAAPGRNSCLLRPSERDHAFQHGQGDASPQGTEGMTTVDQPRLGEVVHGSWFFVLGSWFLVLGSWFLVLSS